MTEDLARDELLALLAWWRTAGVEYALDAEPIDWTAPAGRVPGAEFPWPDKGVGRGDRGVGVPASAPGAGEGRVLPPAAARAPARQPVPVPPAQGAPARMAAMPQPAAPSPPRAFPPTPAPDAATLAAREAARRAPTLAALGETLAGFDGCGLKATAKTLSFYRGSDQARLMVVGEAPGRDEDIAGRPFVGRAGQLLDKMLAAIGLGEADVHITNIVYWRPPGNRTPTPQEVQVCRPFLERQIALVAPEIVLTVGGPATKALLDIEEGIMSVRGRWRDVTIGAHKVRLMPTLHPAYLLRSPGAKRQAWRDLLAVRAALAAPPGRQ